MSCEDSTYYPVNYYPGYYPGYYSTDMIRANGGYQGAQNGGGFPMTPQIGGTPMTMSPSYAVPTIPLGTQFPLGPAVQESFIENILRFNKGKIGTFYFTYQGNNKWNAMIYRGRVETAGRDHIIISDPASGKRYLLLMANLDWVEFDEQINYPIHEINPDVQALMTTTD
jgi:spore germination protein Q